MSVLRTRSAKGSELSHAELDANFKRTVSAKTTTYACLVSDNRSVIECNHATTAFTVTLGDAATMAAAETGDYEVTIANIGAATVTVARAGTDTIDGGATSITLPQYSAVTLKVNNAGNGYNSIARGVGNNTIWHSGNDGTGSGLDADTVDGVEASGLVQVANNLSDVTAAAARTNLDVYSTAEAAPLVGYILVRDEKTQNTDGGTFTLGAWRTRDINTEVTDTGGNCAISSNQITLDAGTYECLIKCPAYHVDEHQARLQNVTDASTTLLGTAERAASGAGVQTSSVIMGRFTIAAQKTFEVQHWSTATSSATGFGYAANITTEIYTVAEFRKVA